MGLLRQIVDSAVGADVDLATTLRRTKVLAAKVHHQELRSWVEHELNGYGEDDPIPQYRTFKTHSLGHFVSTFGHSEMKNANIPPMCLPEELRQKIETVSFFQGVATLEEIARAGDKVMRMPWPADVVAVLGDTFYEGFTLAAAWRVVPRSVVTGVVDGIRNRVLNLALELEDLMPELDEDQRSVAVQATRQDRITQIFNTNIHGGTNTVAQSGAAITQHIDQRVAVGDFESLRRCLLDAGLAPEDVTDLKGALDSEPRQQKPFGKRLSAWIGRMTAKAADGTWQVGTGTAADLLARVLAAYFGIQ